MDVSILFCLCWSIEKVGKDCDQTGGNLSVGQVSREWQNCPSKPSHMRAIEKGQIALKKIVLEYSLCHQIGCRCLTNYCLLLPNLVVSKEDDTKVLKWLVRWIGLKLPMYPKYFEQLHVFDLMTWSSASMVASVLPYSSHPLVGDSFSLQNSYCMSYSQMLLRKTTQVRSIRPPFW